MRRFAFQTRPMGPMGPVCPAQRAGALGPRTSVPPVRLRVARGALVVIRPAGRGVASLGGHVDSGGHAP
jgi:hypothetical protein